MPTVGAILAAERRRQGKSLNDAVEGTKIRSRLLEALENGEYQRLPSPAYVKGFIQSYARYLEIPSAPLLEQYRSEAEQTGQMTSPVDRYLSEIPANTVVPKRDMAHAIPPNVLIAATIAVVAVLLVLCAISRLFGGSQGADTTPTGTPASSEASVSPGATQTAAPTETITATAGGFKLAVTVRDGLASWLKVSVDGRKSYEGTLLGSEGREWLVSHAATLTIGNPSAVVVKRDGKPVTVPQEANAQVVLSAGQ